MTRWLVVLVVALAACKPERASTSIDDAIQAPVAQWKLTRTEWEATVVEPYRARYAEYERAFDAASSSLQAQVTVWRTGKRGLLLATRPHYAGDPGLTRGQARARWALPVQYPATLVTLDRDPVDAVFVRAGNAWRAIVGVDAIVLDATRAIDEPCSHYLDKLGPKACQEVAWEIAEAALRADAARLAHACSLAASQCAR